MAEMYQAWSTGQLPPSYPNNPAPSMIQTQDNITTELSPSFPIYQHYRGTTSQTPQSPPPKPVPYLPPPMTPVFVAPPPATFHKSPSEPTFQAQDNQYYPPEPTFKASEINSTAPRLRQLDMLRPIQSKLPNPPPKNLDYTISCEYCSGAPGHDTEKYKQLMEEKPVSKQNKNGDEPSMIGDEASLSKVAAKQERPKVIIPGVANKPIIFVEGARTDR
uniref:Leucine-rich repeat extensin-like protein 5 n=1 Tax=Nicotiana tabacum TaxID=4097 RepID=A0A1S3XY60_TOBAC